MLYQHIRREFQPLFESPDEKERPTSKFKVLAVKPRHRWGLRSDKTRPYWNQYDLLGLFFAKMGPAPGGGTATQLNFYLPLTAVYVKFCMWIGGKLKPKVTDNKNEDTKGPGVGKPPSMVQCTWGTEGMFFLGASLAGYDKTNAGNWEELVKKKRYDLLEGFYDFPGEWKDWQSSPSQFLKKRILFGNCAETYPFLEILG